MAANLGQAKALCANNADNGLCLNDSRLVDRINEAQRRLVRFHNFIVRKEEYDKGVIEFGAVDDDNDTLPLDDLDATKLMVLALWREENNALDAANALENKARQLIQDEVVEKCEAARKAQWQYNLANLTPGRYGYTKARVGLDLADIALRFSDSRIGGFLNAAEENLMMKGKPVGTIDEFKFDIEADGVVLLPSDVEAVLFAAFGDIPTPVYRQAYEWVENGPFYQTAGDSAFGWSSVMVSRGEVSGQRRFFVRNPYPGQCVRLLCKKRFVVKSDNSTLMTVRNYHALREMVTSLVYALTDPAKAEVHEQRALRLIDQELAEFRGGEQGTATFQVRGSARPVRRIR